MLMQHPGLDSCIVMWLNSLYGKMAAARVVSSDNMNRLQKFEVGFDHSKCCLWANDHNSANCLDLPGDVS